MTNFCRFCSIRIQIFKAGKFCQQPNIVLITFHLSILSCALKDWTVWRDNGSHHDGRLPGTFLPFVRAQFFTAVFSHYLWEITNMVAQLERSNLDLKANKARSEREDKFWNTSTVEMKFGLKLWGLLKTSQIMEWKKWILFTRRFAVTNLNLPDPLSAPICGS